MNLPDGAKLTFTRTHDAWYWDQGLAEADGVAAEFSIVASYPREGSLWELSLQERAGIGWRLGVFDDAWVAFAQVPELFAALAANQELRDQASPLPWQRVQPAVADLVALLLSVGAEDVTPTVSPYQ